MNLHDNIRPTQTATSINYFHHLKLIKDYGALVPTPHIA